MLMALEMQMDQLVRVVPQLLPLALREAVLFAVALLRLIEPAQLVRLSDETIVTRRAHSMPTMLAQRTRRPL
jgi:hypothetical protein